MSEPLLESYIPGRITNLSATLSERAAGESCPTTKQETESLRLTGGIQRSSRSSNVQPNFCPCVTARFRACTVRVGTVIGNHEMVRNKSQALRKSRVASRGESLFWSQTANCPAAAFVGASRTISFLSCRLAASNVHLPDLTIVQLYLALSPIDRAYSIRVSSKLLFRY